MLIERRCQACGVRTRFAVSVGSHCPKCGVPYPRLAFGADRFPAEVAEAAPAWPSLAEVERRNAAASARRLRG